MDKSIDCIHAELLLHFHETLSISKTESTNKIVHKKNQNDKLSGLSKKPSFDNGQKMPIEQSPMFYPSNSIESDVNNQSFTSSYSTTATSSKKRMDPVKKEISLHKDRVKGAQKRKKRKDEGGEAYRKYLEDARLSTAENLKKMRDNPEEYGPQLKRLKASFKKSHEKQKLLRTEASTKKHTAETITDAIIFHP